MTMREIWENLRADFRTLGALFARGFDFVLRWSIFVVVVVLGLVIVVHLGIALFGNHFEADKAVLGRTAEAQATTTRALYHFFDDFGRLHVRSDYSVYAYISKRNFMLVPFPDREEAINIVGKAWCESKSVEDSWFSMPKVQLRDLFSGEVLGTYRCIGEVLRQSTTTRRGR